MAKLSRNDNRVARHERVRKTISGTPEVPLILSVMEDYYASENRDLHNGGNYSVL